MKLTLIDIVIPDWIDLHMKFSNVDEYIKDVITLLKEPDNMYAMKDWLEYIYTTFPQHKEKIEKYLILI